MSTSNIIDEIRKNREAYYTELFENYMQMKSAHPKSPQNNVSQNKQTFTEPPSEERRMNGIAKFREKLLNFFSEDLEEFSREEVFLASKQ